MQTVPKLGRRELEIMNVIWDLGQATVRQVWQRLGTGAYTTVLTMMRALEQHKGVLTHVERGKAYLYRPTVTRQEVSRSYIADLHDLVFGGSLPLLVHNLLGYERPTTEDLEALKTIIAQQEKRARR